MTRALLMSGCLLALVTAAACGKRSDTASLKELHRSRAGELEIVLLSGQDAVRHGKDSFVIEFRRADGSLTDVGTVRVNATMPMAGMAPMLGGTEVHPSDVKGRYTVTSDLSMAGSWRFIVEWDGPAGRGSTSFPATVR
ncbi:MAG TPA: FixH family protein [Vicinamibacterales bacterium]|jgi:hypothetical protein|nr:FixH family protein [Vicinamibacterales bacterium]